MNILITPFHDWRKILLEGFRTRDAHFIEELNKNKSSVKIVVNRPTTFLEIILKRKRNLIQGDVILFKSNFRLYKIDENFYVVDFVSNKIFGQIKGGYKWFINQYKNEKYISFIKACLKHLNIEEDYALLNQNIFAYKLSESLNPKTSVFDAWDNFAKFNVYAKINTEIQDAYKSFSNSCDFWITNATENISEFQNKYQVKNIHLVKNGVDVSRFTNKSNGIPNDLSIIKKPIVGFGGKITHLLDVELINKTTEMSPDISFVFVGQILDKTIFEGITKRNNVHYLGDKHYDIYPDYVKNFDVCIVPYIVEEKKKTGANTIKVYEYLATGKKVIGTLSNGLEDLQDHVYIIHNALGFSQELKELTNKKEQIDLKEHSWKTKTKQIADLIKS